MEKLIYLLGCPQDASVESLGARLRENTVARLRAAGAARIRACIRDERVEPAAPRRQGDLSRDAWCYLSLWADSRCIHPELKTALESVSSFAHGYAVAESEQLGHDFECDGSRTEGMSQVVLFRKPADLDRARWLKIWLESHTRVAIDTQSTFGYLQHIVGDTLDADTPRFDAIVEENFPAAAMTSDFAFYDAGDDPEKLRARVQSMMDSVTRFIDLESIQVMPLGEYNFR